MARFFMATRAKRFGGINASLAIAWLALAVLGVQAVFPPLRAMVNSYVLTVASYAVAFVAMLALYRANQIKVDMTLILSLFALLFIAFSAMLTGNSVLFNRYFYLISLIAGYPLFRLVVDCMGKREKTVLFYTIVGFASITCIRTCLALVENPYIARSIKSEGEYTAGLLSMGIGGYEIVYFAVICLTVIFWVFLNARDTKKRLVALSAFLIMFLLILFANYITALIAAIIGMILVLGMKIGNVSPAAAIFLSMAIVIVLVVLVFNQDQLLQFIANISGGARVSKVLSSSGSLLAGVSNEFLVDRAPVMLKSLEAFGEHPLIGLAGLTSTVGANGVIVLAGQHSFVLDTLAYFGLVGGTIILFAVFVPFRDMEKHGIDKRLVAPLLVVVLVLLVFNNATSSMAIAALLLPLLLAGDGNE